MKTLTEKDQAYVCDIQAPCFQALSPEELALLQESKTQVLFHKGETLVKQGAFASYILFLHSGIAKQYIEAEGTRNLNIRLLGPGEFAGLPAVFTDRKFSYSVAALSEVHAFLIEIDAIGQLMQHNAAFSFPDIPTILPVPNGASGQYAPFGVQTDEWPDGRCAAVYRRV